MAQGTATMDRPRQTSFRLGEAELKLLDKIGDSLEASSGLPFNRTMTLRLIIQEAAFNRKIVKNPPKLS